MSRGQTPRTRANFPRMKIRNPKPWRWNGTKTFTALLGDQQITFGPLSIYAIPASAKSKALISGMRLHH